MSFWTAILSDIGNNARLTATLLNQRFNALTAALDSCFSWNSLASSHEMTQLPMNLLVSNLSTTENRILLPTASFFNEGGPPVRIMRSNVGTGLRPTLDNVITITNDAPMDYIPIMGYAHPSLGEAFRLLNLGDYIELAHSGNSVTGLLVMDIRTAPFLISETEPNGFLITGTNFYPQHNDRVTICGSYATLINVLRPKVWWVGLTFEVTVTGNVDYIFFGDVGDSFRILTYNGGVGANVITGPWTWNYAEGGFQVGDTFRFTMRAANYYDVVRIGIS